MLEQKGQRPVDGLLADRVVVVEDQRERLSFLADAVDEGRQHRLDCRRPSALPQPQPLAYVHPRRLQGGAEMRQKANRVVVALVQREPGDALMVALEPRSNERRLAETGGGTNERQLARFACIQALEQPGTGHQAGTCLRHEQFGRQERARLEHGTSPHLTKGIRAPGEASG